MRRLIAGVVAGALVSAIALPAFFFSDDFQISLLPIWAGAAFLLAAHFLMPVIFVPVWLFARRVGVFGALAAGGVAFVVGMVLIGLVFGRLADSTTWVASELAVDLLAFAAIGSIAGLAFWLVACWRVA